MKENGQAEQFSGYGGIEDLMLYMRAEYGSQWLLQAEAVLDGISGFVQNLLEAGAPNCTLASITRVMKYYRERQYKGIPEDLHDIYRIVRKIGVIHGYDPHKCGIIRDVFVYTPFEIDNMVRDAWDAFGYPEGTGDNDYFKKWSTIREQVDAGHPLLLSLTVGDYEGHTVTVAGYTVFTDEDGGEKRFIRIFDGWSETVRFIDWARMKIIPASITKIIPPETDNR